MKSKAVLATIMASSIFMGVGCTNTGFQRGEEIAYQPVVNERYQNHIEIDGQWDTLWTGGEYGIGDPFVMRYNGKYYLYCSTYDPCVGIKVFESTDMLNWTYKGFAVSEEEETSRGAYAPEVVYYNGYFYMCQSRGGKGHYIYRSESPTEGFTLVSKTDDVSSDDISYGNLGMGIDGSFYVSDDGKLYLLHTSTPAGLKYNEIKDVNDIRIQTIGTVGTLGDANLNHWIEGPGIFRRGEYSYLTYTGNHVNSNGYRIGYSYAKNLTDLSSFTQPTDNITIIDTSSEHYGLGHSSNFNGPDLDSIYTAYHDLIGWGPERRYNLDRYFASGSVLTANGVTYRPVAKANGPTMSATNGSELTYTSNAYVLGNSKDYFTAEFNFIPCDGQKLYFGNGYAVYLTNDGLALEKDGKLVKDAVATYAKDKLNTVRVENGDGIGYIYLNGMRLIEYEAQSSNGMIGYAKANGVEYTAFTDEVFGSSDFEAVKNFPTRFPATTYLKGENRGFSIEKASVVKGGVRVGEKQNIIQTEDEENAVLLGKEDWVKYAVDIGDTCEYSLSARISSCSGATLKITIGEQTHVVDVAASTSAKNVSLGMMTCNVGVTTMKVEVVSGEIGLIWLEARNDSTIDTDMTTEAYTRLNGTVAAENGEVRLTSGSGNGDDSVAVWGGTGMSDYIATLEFTASADTTEFGFMVRENHYSYHADQPMQSWRGYYVLITPQMISLRRYDYSDELLKASRISLCDGQSHTLKVQANGSEISVWVDGEPLLKANDSYAFMYGKFGVYTANGNVSVRNIQLEKI